MINNHDERDMRRLVSEMNIGFSAPQNGGVDGSGIIILQNGEDPEAVDGEQNGNEEGANAQQLVHCVIDNLNHLLRDLEQGCQGDAQIEQLQQCCSTLSQAIEEIGNNTSDKNQGSAFTGLNNNDPDSSDTPEGASAEVGMGLAT